MCMTYKGKTIECDNQKCCMLMLRRAGQHFSYPASSIILPTQTDDEDIDERKEITKQETKRE